MTTTTTAHRCRPQPAAVARSNPRRAGAWALLVLAIAVSVLPFLWVLRTALSTNAPWPHIRPACFRRTSPWRLHARVRAAEPGRRRRRGRFRGRHRLLALPAELHHLLLHHHRRAVFFSAMAAYAFARLRWKGRNAVFSLFLGTMLVPPIFTALPNFLLIKNLDLLNTMLGMVLPYLFMTPFAIFFLRQFFLNMSREVEEAAMLDGARHLRIFFQIVLPNAAAPIATLALLTFIGQWNEYFWPLLVGSQDDVRVLQVGLGVFKSQTPQGSPDWSGLMAATLVSALPVLILFAVFGKKIVNSIGFSGIK